MHHHPRTAVIMNQSGIFSKDLLPQHSQHSIQNKIYFLFLDLKSSQNTMIAFLRVQCIRPGNYLIPISQVRKLRHTDMYGPYKTVQLAFNSTSPIRTGARMEDKKSQAFKYSEFLPLEGGQWGKALHDSCMIALEIIFFCPSLPLSFLMPSHQNQLAVPHIKGRMRPSQLLLLCIKLYPGEQHSQRG